MSFTDFALVRISRLYPLLIAATLLSAAYMAMSSIRRHDDLGWLALLPAAVLALPDPSRTFAPDPFPLLPVVWSLFFELFANFVYASCAEWSSTRRLSVVVGVSAILLLFALVLHGNGEIGNTYATLWAGVASAVLFLGRRALLSASRSGTAGGLQSFRQWCWPQVSLHFSRCRTRLRGLMTRSAFSSCFP